MSTQPAAGDCGEIHEGNHTARIHAAVVADVGTAADYLAAAHAKYFALCRGYLPFNTVQSCTYRTYVYSDMLTFLTMVATVAGVWNTLLSLMLAWIVPRLYWRRWTVPHSPAEQQSLDEAEMQLKAKSAVPASLASSSSERDPPRSSSPSDFIHVRVSDAAASPGADQQQQSSSSSSILHRRRGGLEDVPAAAAFPPADSGTETESEDAPLVGRK